MLNRSKLKKSADTDGKSSFHEAEGELVSRLWRNSQSLISNEMKNDLDRQQSTTIQPSRVTVPCSVFKKGHSLEQDQEQGLGVQSRRPSTVDT